MRNLLVGELERTESGQIFLLLDRDDVRKRDGYIVWLKTPINLERRIGENWLRIGVELAKTRLGEKVNYRQTISSFQYSAINCTIARENNNVLRAYSLWV